MLVPMPALAKMPAMGKKTGAGSVNVQGRLTEEEVVELDHEAESLPVPVTRGALVSHILREWLRLRREAKQREKGKASK